jgi:hypothetical protein
MLRALILLDTATPLKCSRSRMYFWCRCRILERLCGKNKPLATFFSAPGRLHTPPIEAPESAARVHRWSGATRARAFTIRCRPAARSLDKDFAASGLRGILVPWWFTQRIDHCSLHSNLQHNLRGYARVCSSSHRHESAVPAFDESQLSRDNRTVASLRVGLWRSWERASMAWKRSSVRSRSGPPNTSQNECLTTQWSSPCGSL